MLVMQDINRPWDCDLVCVCVCLSLSLSTRVKSYLRITAYLHQCWSAVLKLKMGNFSLGDKALLRQYRLDF